MFLFSFGAQLSLSLVLISHITYFGAQMSYISVLISHIANFGAHFAYLYPGAQLSVFLMLKTHLVHHPQASFTNKSVVAVIINLYQFLLFTEHCIKFMRTRYVYLFNCLNYILSVLMVSYIIGQ